MSNFISAIKNAGGYVSIAATYRPPERAYLMHWSWMISHEKVKADEVPPMMGVHIEWDHGDDNKSKRAAAGMVSAYGMGALKIAPALRSRHTERKAIDMNIGWRGTLKIIDANGDEVEIRSSPSSGMNSDLHKVGKSYGVIKFWKGAKDKPHWSTDGR
ncbi:hypothetical protein [Aquitalea magnusonii]|uniref:hypothetical protein n=1 Tax=Aquitalea magnusonii TaxID=332411 RepID=UPI0018D51339|nr:hypothetical protein [Aquitalea magnusonii]